MLYIRICYERSNLSTEREERRPAQQYFLEHLPFRIVQSGPLCLSDEDSTSTASFMIIEANSREEVVSMHEDDPFVRADLYRQVHIHRWDKQIG